MNVSALIVSHVLPGISYCNALSCGCICCYSRHMAHCLTIFSLSIFVLVQYTNSLTSSCVFSMPMGLLCSCSSSCFCKIQGIIIHLSFMTILFIIASSCPFGQYLCLLESTSSLGCGQPLLKHIFSICKSVSWLIAALMSSIHVQIGRSTFLLIVHMLTFMPVIPDPCSLYGCCRIANLLYMIQDQDCMRCTCYIGGCTAQCTIFLGECCDILITIASNGLWCVITYTSLAKQ